MNMANGEAREGAVWLMKHPDHEASTSAGTSNV
jgi:hypothetical protein